MTALYGATDTNSSTIISNNTVIGQYALDSPSKINETVGLGTSLGANLSSSDTLFGVTLIGSSATTVSGVVSNSTALGYRATVTLSNTIQLGNSDVNLVNTSATVSATAFVGDGSGLTNIGTSSSTFKDAYSNVVVGSKLVSLTPSIIIQGGDDAFKGYRNLAIGDSTLVSNTNGRYNVALGHSALYSNTTGDRNTAIRI